MRTYAGIDLHSSNNYVGIIDENDKRLFKKRIPNRMSDVLTVLSPFKEEDAKKLFGSPNLIAMAQNSISAIEFLKKVTKRIEKTVASQVKMRKEFEMLLTMPGIGLILGLTIMLEVGDISRFRFVGNYSSYCRCVGSKRTSNGKKKGENNKRNGNKYLA